MRSHPARRKLGAATPTAFHIGPRWAATFNFRWVGAAGGPLRAYCVVRAHIAPVGLSAATPTAFHTRASWAADEIECRVLLKLPDTNRAPTFATPLRHT